MTEKPQEIKYPFFDKPFIGIELRPYLWKVTDPSTLWLSPTNSHTPPKGFITDGYSIPSWAQWLIPKGLPGKRTPTLHDWFCEMGKRGTPVVSYKEAHRIFEVTIMLEDGIAMWRKKGMAWAVKVGGPRW